MPGAPVHRGGRIARTAVSAFVVAVPLLVLGTTSSTAAGPAANADRSGLRLPQPVREVDPLATPQLGLRPDRLLTSQVPGRVNDAEDVHVAL